MIRDKVKTGVKITSPHTEKTSSKDYLTCFVNNETFVLNEISGTDAEPAMIFEDENGELMLSVSAYNSDFGFINLKVSLDENHLEETIFYFTEENNHQGEFQFINKKRTECKLFSSSNTMSFGKVVIREIENNFVQGSFEFDARCENGELMKVRDGRFKVRLASI